MLTLLVHVLGAGLGGSGGGVLVCTRSTSISPVAETAALPLALLGARLVEIRCWWVA